MTSWFNPVGLALACAMACGSVCEGRQEATAPDAPPAPPLAAEAERPLTPIQQHAVLGTGAVPMVLIPEIGFDWTVWKGFMERNASRYTMYAITLPGIGGTEAPIIHKGETWESMVLTTNAGRALLQFIESQGLDRPVLVGHGFGGLLAMKFALDHPARTRGVVSVDGMPVVPLGDPNQDDSPAERKRILKEGIVPRFMMISDQEWRDRHFISTMSLVQDDFRARDLALMLSKQHRAVYMHYFFESFLLDVRPRLNSLAVPMLCIAAVKPEPPPPPAVFHMFWERNLGAPPGTWLTFYPNCHHFVMDDNPEQLDADVNLFIRGEAIPGAKRAVDIPPPPPPDPEAPRTGPMPSNPNKQPEN